ncbi:Uncharacterised protein [uncultured archaeon]|nr:Uncharacterised protein [uncultured archaeon]
MSCLLVVLIVLVILIIAIYFLLYYRFKSLLDGYWKIETGDNKNGYIYISDKKSYIQLKTADYDLDEIVILDYPKYKFPCLLCKDKVQFDMYLQTEKLGTLASHVILSENKMVIDLDRTTLTLYRDAYLSEVGKQI